ncbi:RNA polymerase sigma factor [Aquimarina algiphila]|uniref:RNA polymerase sigma factor n=1 Tax=Aquimarina algiphila TaxID=2047982 RepID=UPI00232FF8E7|nr:RNA polymerase sigma factor [Aquimarina algiphila]
MIKRDKDTFLEIIESHKLIIFKICNMYCKDTEDKKDLVQEVILQLWKSFPKYDESFKLSTWIYRISLNVSISNYRKLSTRQKYFDSMSHGNMVVAVDKTQDMEEQTHLLRQMIDQLNEVNKAIIILYLEEKSYEEIAAILSISKSAVGVRINRIKKIFKEKFKSLT